MVTDNNNNNNNNNNDSDNSNDFMHSLDNQAKCCLMALNHCWNNDVSNSNNKWCHLEHLETLLNLKKDNYLDCDLLDCAPFGDLFYTAVIDFIIHLFRCCNDSYYSNNCNQGLYDYFHGLYRGMNILHALIYYYRDTGCFHVNRIVTSKVQSITMQFYTNLPQLHTLLNNMQKRHRQQLILSNATDRTYAANLADQEATESIKRFQSFLQKLQYWIHALYQHSDNTAHRINMRKLMGNYLQFMGTFLLRHGVSTGLSYMLDVLGFIQVQNDEVNLDLLHRLLVPLCYSNTLSSWRDQQCSLELYFQSLRNLILCVINRSKDHNGVSEDVIATLCSPKVWPHHAIHTGKLVWILCLLQDLLAYLNQAASLPQIFLSKYLSICQSEHSRVAEKALLFFRDDNFLRLLKNCFAKNSASINPFLKALIRPGNVSWNPTVNKFTYLALKQSSTIISRIDFNQAIEDIFSSTNSNKLSGIKRNHLTFGKAPGVCVTGVAPWAMQGKHHMKKMSHVSSKVPNIRPRFGSDVTQETATSSYQSYMDSLLPKGSKENKLQIYPDLSRAKFHDFVFDGKPLGSGSFSIVKYAKYICRGNSNSVTIDSSQWPVYAIKILDKKKLAEYEYWGNVNREIAILTLMNELRVDEKSSDRSTNQNIIRLFTTFHLHGNVYMVMEYAPLGDLFNFIPIFGKTSQLRFVLDEVTKGLKAVHDLGFVFGDLKPENILLCSDQHLKLTDFGAARPVTSSSKQAMKDIGNILDKVRDGYWKSNGNENKLNVVGSSMWDDIEERIEGTKAYLPPEILESNGKALTISADMWALGCVFFQCMTGRIPISGGSGKKYKNNVVSFNNSDELLLYGHVVRSALVPEGFARDLLASLLSNEASKRISVSEVLSHQFLNGPTESLKAEDNVVKSNMTGNGEEGVWARRQYSSIWAPLDPGSGNITTNPNNPGSSISIGLLSSEDSAIVDIEGVDGVKFGNGDF